MFRMMTHDEREILAFHFNPDGPEARPYPHLHLGPAAEVGLRVLTRAHIPTAIVTLAHVIRLLVDEFAVKPRRSDWRAVLDDDGAGR